MAWRRSGAGILLIGPFGTNFSEIFIQENESESVVCEMAAVLSRPQCVKRPLDDLSVITVSWKARQIHLRKSAFYDYAEYENASHVKRKYSRC